MTIKVAFEHQKHEVSFNRKQNVVKKNRSFRIRIGILVLYTTLEIKCGVS